MTQPAYPPVPPDLPADGTYIYHTELDALQAHPDLLMAFMGLRYLLLRGEDQPSAEDLGRLLHRRPRAAAELVARLEALGIVGRVGEPRGYVINPVGLWQIQPAGAQPGFVLPPPAGAGAGS